MKRKNLWAPWRVKYIQGLSQESDCFLCDYYSTPQKDNENLLLWRTEHAFVVFNKFPYNLMHFISSSLFELKTYMFYKFYKSCSSCIICFVNPRVF